MNLLDTNVLVYAIGSEHPLRAPAQAVIDQIRAGAMVAGTIELVHAEFLHVYSRSRPRAEAVDALHDYIGLIGTPLLLDERDRAVALELYATHPSLNANDAFLAAMSLRPEIDAIVTADRGFSGVPGLDVLDLATVGSG